MSMNQVTEANVSTDRDIDFWRAHVIAARDFIGTDAEYCRRNGINDKTFSSYKTKFGFTKTIKKGRPKKFIKIKRELLSVDAAKPLATKSSRGELDPKWMAEFVSALLNSRQ